MSGTNISLALVSGLTDFGLAMLVILTMTLSVAVGFFIFRAGWNSVKDSDK